VKWTEPAVDAEIRRVAGLKRPIVLVPVAFVSEHTETLVELDKTMRALALTHGAPFYGRVRTAGTHPRFIAALADLVKEAITPGIHPGGGARPCGPSSRRCPLFNR
jgi:ferrochelatase